MMTEEEFTRAASEIRHHCEYLYFHLLGEPLLHPELERFFEIAYELGFKVIITTNGTLLERKKDVLLNAPALWKVSISLHSFEANDRSVDMREYLDSCLGFCREASEKGIICVLRLWNRGGEEERNDDILSVVREYYSDQWKETRSGYKLADRAFLEWGEKFDWPDMDAECGSGKITCYGLRDQIGVHSDGTVVPCCLDAEGDIALGNIFTQPLDEILESERATRLKRSFETRCVTEPLCLRCGYAHQKMY
jgi:radical SAM protein with 4Fe4S-binding SPASM domain